MERFNRLAHSIWDCKYHIVWIPKYRRKALYGEKRKIVVETIKQWARIKGIEIIEGHAIDWRQLEILFGDNYFSRFSP